MKSSAHSPPESRRPRLAASHYLNSAPLIWSFIRGARKNKVSLIDAVPAVCGEMLAKGEVACALIPSIEYQRVPDIVLVRDVCVGSRGSVRSVVLVSRVSDIRKIRSVALDESSRTSAALLKIIFREFLQSEPNWVTCSPNLDRMLSENEAALIIGDPAMTFSRRDLYIFDMARMWRDYTNLGFVFAMWAVRDSEAGRFADVDFVSARDEGLAEIDSIVSDYATKIPLPVDELKHYLTENITFEIDDDMERGLKLYFDLAYKHGLIDKNKELRFVDLATVAAS